MLHCEKQPAVVRLLMLLGGVCLAVGPFLGWWETYGIDGTGREVAGIASFSGWVVFLAGLVTLIFVFVPRLAPLGLVTGLVAGAIAGLRLIDFLNIPFALDSVTELEDGLVFSLGGAALTGAGGVIAASVAAALAASRSDTVD